MPGLLKAKGGKSGELLCCYHTSDHCMQRIVDSSLEARDTEDKSQEEKHHYNKLLCFIR